MSDDYLLQRAPAGPLDYGFNWNDGWLDEGETITSSTWTIDPLGPMLSGEQFSPTGITAVAVTTTLAHAGRQYQLVNEIVSSEGFNDTRAFTIRVARP